VTNGEGDMMILDTWLISTGLFPAAISRL